MNIKALILAFCSTILVGNVVFNEAESVYSFSDSLGQLGELQRVVSYIKPSPVIAKVAADTSTFQSAGKSSPKIGELKKGTPVTIIQDRSRQYYLVENTDFDIKGWVTKESLIIPPDSPTLTPDMDAGDKELFVNLMRMPVKKEYFVWVDIARQKNNVFKGSVGSLKLIKSFDCSTGTNESPTTRGFFNISERGGWFYSTRLGSGGKYWVRFNGSYLFHSVAMDKQQKIVDSVLGTKHSSGCVRMAVDDAKWFYENVPDETFVFVY